LITINCSGLNCPEPVLRTREALSKYPDSAISILVDNETARENVLRFVQKQGRVASWIKDGNTIIISIEEDRATTKNTDTIPDKKPLTTEKPVILLTTNLLGQGSDELGAILMRSFIYTLTRSEVLPSAIILMNSGVRLAVNNANTQDELTELINRGVKVLVCGTCLDYYGLKDILKSGEISNMYDISALLLNADKVITV